MVFSGFDYLIFTLLFKISLYTESASGNVAVFPVVIFALIDRTSFVAQDLTPLTCVTHKVLFTNEANGGCLSGEGH